MNSENTFRYIYSAANAREVQAIRNKYLPQAENKMDELKRLDRLVQGAGMTQSLSVGISGIILLGLGLCLAIQVLGNMPVIGVILGLIGTAAILSAYPVYRSISEKAKKKYRGRILQLAEELSGEI